MKQLIFSALMMIAFSVAAQAPAKEAPKPEPMKAASKPEASKAASATPRKGPRRWNEDARHCLEKPTNTEIIKCAEEYL